VRPPRPLAIRKPEEEQFCPSARCEEDAILLGIVGANGIVGYVTPQITIDADFVREARRGRIPETRFRFAQPCIESRCAQWADSHCGLINRVLEFSEGKSIAEASRGPLPKCVIRPLCRWFAQEGDKACAVCPVIIHSRDNTT